MSAGLSPIEPGSMLALWSRSRNPDLVVSSRRVLDNRVAITTLEDGREAYVWTDVLERDYAEDVGRRIAP